MKLEPGIEKRFSATLPKEARAGQLQAELANRQMYHNKRGLYFDVLIGDQQLVVTDVDATTATLADVDGRSITVVVKGAETPMQRVTTDCVHDILNNVQLTSEGNYSDSP